MSDGKVAPIAALAKCDFCGAPARLDHLRPDPIAPIDHFVYRCTSCSAFTILQRPRPPRRGDAEEGIRPAV